MGDKKLKSNLNLQPDAYTRFITVIYLIQKIIAQKKKDTYSILDVGGSSGYLDSFLRQSGISYDLTVIDPLPRPKNLPKSVKYIQAGGETLSTLNESFDITTAIDVLEHIPGDKLKKDIVTAMADVTAMGMILVGPFDTSRTDIYEHQLNDINKLLFKVDQNWLSEHFKYGKPNMGRVASHISNARKDLKISSAFTLPFDFWLESSFVNLMPYASYFLKKGRVEAVNATFNGHYSKDIEHSFVEEGYRGIVVASVSKIELKIENDLTWPYTNRYVALVAELLAASTKHTEQLKQQNAQFEHRLQNDTETIQLRKQILNLEAENRRLANELADSQRKLHRVKSIFPVNAVLKVRRTVKRIKE